MHVTSCQVILEYHMQVLHVVLIGEIVATVLAIASMGQHETTVIQFVLNQLLGVSSSQFSAIIQWYLWVMCLGNSWLFALHHIKKYVGTFYNYGTEAKW